MNKQNPTSHFSYNRFGYALWPFVLLLLGCRPTTPNVLPTLIATAVPPILITPSTPEQVPATFTTSARSFLDHAGINTRIPTRIPPLAPTAADTPTPLSLSAIEPQTIRVPFLETPPDSVDCDSPGLVLKSHFPSRIGSPWRSYHAYLPPCYGIDGRAYPVIYLIHGSIQTDSHWFDLGLTEYAAEGIRSGRYPPFIVIMPFSGRLGNISSGGWNSIEGIIVTQLIPYVDATYCTWSESAGRSIGGISRGGYWALEIAFSNPSLFGAVAGHSSHLRFETDPARYNPLATYANNDLSQLRIWLDRGEKDFLRTGQDHLHDYLSQVGIAHEYHINTGGHSDAYWAEHIGEYLDWHIALWPKDRNEYPTCN